MNYQYIDPRVRVFKEEKQGVSYARKKGFQEAKGEYVYFIDGDDCVSKTGIEKMVLAAQKYHADMVQGHFIRLEDKRNIPRRDKKHAHKVRDISKNDPSHLLYQLPPLWMRLYKKELIQDYYFSSLPQKEDDIFTYYAYADAECIIQIPDVVYYYLQTSTGLSSVENTIPYHLYVNEIAKIVKYYADKGLFPSCEESFRTQFTISLLDLLQRTIYKNRNFMLQQRLLNPEKVEERYNDIYENEEELKMLISLLGPYDNEDIVKDSDCFKALSKESIEVKPYEKIKMKKIG